MVGAAQRRTHVATALQEDKLHAADDAAATDLNKESFRHDSDETEDLRRAAHLAGWWIERRKREFARDALITPQDALIREDQAADEIALLGSIVREDLDLSIHADLNLALG